MNIYEITVTGEELDLILQTLAELPYKQVGVTIERLYKMAKEQKEARENLAEQVEQQNQKEGADQCPK